MYMNQIEISTLDTCQGIEKTKRYGWITKDEPGTLQMLNKSVLMVHPAYQRDLIERKALDIAAAWSWVGCGALVVGRRCGELWVIDGQHRLMAAKRRSDITLLPCLVFDTEDIKQEARGFIDLNTGRKPINAFARQKALLSAGDEVAAFVQKTCDALNLTMKRNPSKAGDLRAVAWCVKRASENANAFVQVLTLAHELSQADGMPIPERLLDGLWLLNQRVEGGLENRRMNKRLREKGARTLLDAANRAAVFYVAGGGLVWAKGILAELNKGLQNKFVMDGEE